jgi:hypothetical protein
MVNTDFEEFFALLNQKQVKYLLIGGVAYNHYASPRATKDIDVWVCPDPSNLRYLLDAIREFGFPTGELSIEELASTTKVLMLGRVPNRIDVLTRPVGVEWEEAWGRKERTQFGSVAIPVIGLIELIQAKRAAGRPRDIADVAMLEAVQAHYNG